MEEVEIVKAEKGDAPDFIWVTYRTHDGIQNKTHVHILSYAKEIASEIRGVRWKRNMRCDSDILVATLNKTKKLEVEVDINTT